MKRIFISCAAGFLLLASVVYAFADLAKPKSSPAAPKEGKVVFHTGLTIVPDTKIYEARLQITQEELKSLREALASVPADPSMIQRVTHSSTRTIMAGVFLFLSVSFAGVWLARSGRRRSQKAIAAVLLCAAVIGAATVIARANAGPPGWYRWAGLPQALKDGKETAGSLDIEIVPEGEGMRLIIPTRRVNKPNDEE
jgi:cytochrome bd-type quinol oxidase subunit 1